MSLQLFPKVSWRNSARKAKYIWEVSGRNVTVWCGTTYSTTSGKRKQKSKQAKFCCRVTKHKWPTREGASLLWHIHILTIGHIRYMLVKCRQVNVIFFHLYPLPHTFVCVETSSRWTSYVVSRKVLFITEKSVVYAAKARERDLRLNRDSTRKCLHAE